MGIIPAERSKDAVLLLRGRAEDREGEEHLYFRKKFTPQFQADKMDLQILKATVSNKYLQVGSLG